MVNGSSKAFSFVYKDGIEGQLRSLTPDVLTDYIYIIRSKGLTLLGENLAPAIVSMDSFFPLWSKGPNRPAPFNFEAASQEIPKSKMDFKCTVVFTDQDQSVEFAKGNDLGVSKVPFGAMIYFGDENEIGIGFYDGIESTLVALGPQEVANYSMGSMSFASARKLNKLRDTLATIESFEFEHDPNSLLAIPTLHVTYDKKNIRGSVGKYHDSLMHIFHSCVRGLDAKIAGAGRSLER